MIEAIVFDMDGVLFDTERISFRCFFEAARRLEIQITEEAVYGCFGLNEEDGKAFVLRAMESVYPNGSFPYAAFRKKLGELFEEQLQKGVPVMDGVRELLAFLKEKGIKTAVASSTHYGRVMRNLETSGLTPYFERIITGDMVEHSKPLPDIYLKACGALGVSPERAMAVEDSPNGIRAAAAAGMVAVMVPDMIKPTEELAALYDMKFDSLRGLLAHLRKELEG